MSKEAEGAESIYGWRRAWEVRGVVVAAVGRKARRRGWHPGAGGPGHGAPVLSWSASGNEAVERHSIEAQTRWERVGRVAALGGVARLVFTHFVPSRASGAQSAGALA